MYMNKNWKSRDNNDQTETIKVNMTKNSNTRTK
jgi:hypothetical protein